MAVVTLRSPESTRRSHPLGPIVLALVLALLCGFVFLPIAHPVTLEVGPWVVCGATSADPLCRSVPRLEAIDVPGLEELDGLNGRNYRIRGYFHSHWLHGWGFYYGWTWFRGKRIAQRL